MVKFVIRIGGKPHVIINMDSIERIEWVDVNKLKIQYKSGVERTETFDGKHMMSFFMDLYLALHVWPENVNIPDWNDYPDDTPGVK